MLDKLSATNKEILKNMMHSLQQEELKANGGAGKERCMKSSKIKPQMQENQEGTNQSNKTENYLSNGNSLKIKKSSKIEPNLQKKIRVDDQEDERINKISMMIDEELGNMDMEENNEDQLKSLLEKSMLQKRLIDHTTVEKQVNVQGSFESYDVPARILEGKISMQIDNKYFLKCVVEWKQRPNGVQPMRSSYDNVELRKYCPQLLLDFYETKIIPKQEIEQQQQQLQLFQGNKNDFNDMKSKQELYRGKEMDAISISSQESNKEKCNGVQTMDTCSNSELQRKKLLDQINQEENESQKQKQKLLEIIKQNEEKQQQIEKEETDIDRCKKQLLKQMQQQEQNKQDEQNQNQNQEQSLMDMIKEQSQQQKKETATAENENVSGMKLYLQKIMEEQEELQNNQNVKENETELKTETVEKDSQKQPEMQLTSQESNIETNKPLIQSEKPKNQEENLEIIEENNQFNKNQKAQEIHQENSTIPSNSLKSKDSINKQQQIENQDQQKSEGKQIEEANHESLKKNQQIENANEVSKQCQQTIENSQENSQEKCQKKSQEMEL